MLFNTINFSVNGVQYQTPYATVINSFIDNDTDFYIEYLGEAGHRDIESIIHSNIDFKIISDELGIFNENMSKNDVLDYIHNFEDESIFKQLEFLSRKFNCKVVLDLDNFCHNIIGEDFTKLYGFKNCTEWVYSNFDVKVKLTSLDIVYFIYPKDTA